MLWKVVALTPQQGVVLFQDAIIRAIEDLRPSPSVPAVSVLDRIYDVMYHRFVLKLTQEKTAECLCMSVRNLRRAQRQSIHALAGHLWRHSNARKAPADHVGAGAAIETPKVTWTNPASPGWVSQVRQELASLHSSAPEAVTDLAECVCTAIALLRVLALKQGIVLEAVPFQSQLSAQIHPSAFKQVLLATIVALARDMHGGRIVLSAEREEDQFRVSITACPRETHAPIELSLVQEILAVYAGTIEFRRDGNRSCLLVQVPVVPAAEEKATVLVLDDNSDIIRSYELFAIGTRYQVMAATAGQCFFEALETAPPDVIVLDVMLPDVDGWELLVELHAHPATRSIPVIVCSVVDEKELALALGATLYLKKPVLRRQFIEALDQTLIRAS